MWEKFVSNDPVCTLAEVKTGEIMSTFLKVLAETLFKRISLLVFKQKWLMQLNFYHSIAILTDLRLIQGVLKGFAT